MELKSLIEAILFAAQKPVSLKEIKTVLTDADPSMNPEMVHAFRRTREAEIAGAIEELKIEEANFEDVIRKFMEKEHSSFSTRNIK